MEPETLLCLPSLERLKEVLSEDSIKASGNVVPIFRTVSSQILPISNSPEEAVMQVYLRLRRGPYSFLLEGVTEAVHRQRYVVMGSEPYKVIETGKRKGGKIEDDIDPLTLLEEEMKKWKMIDLPELQVNHNWLGGENEEVYADYRAIPLGSCGAIGYVAYDAVRHFEPRVNNQNKADPLGLPEAVWMFYNCLVAYDFHKHCCHIVSLCRTDGDLETNYKEAISRLEELQARLLAVRGGEEEPLDDYTIKDEGVSNAGEEGYKNMVTALKKHIVAGDIIQAVPSHRLSRTTPVHPFKIYRELRKLNPSPYMYYFDLKDFQIVGASPECLVRVDDGIVSTHPIAGTSKRGKNAEEDRILETKLISDPKERAEHIMLVDLGRNDVNRVCDSHSTKVDRLMVCERYAHVMHIVSKVTGRLRPDKTAFDAFRSVFPAGTVSGAPKVRAMELINELEKEVRSVYAGCVGYVSFSGTMDTCIAIRTLVYKNGVAYIQAGGGIVLDSDEQYEYNETVHKMKSQLTAVEKAEITKETNAGAPNASYSVHPSKRDQPQMRFSKWDNSSFALPEGFKWGGSDPSSAPEPPTPLGGTVLLIDNYDSFTWNLYQYLSMLGAHVVVHRNDQITVQQAVAMNPDRIVISPGPGTPDSTGVCRDIIKEFAGKVPILGVCLGHQTIVDVFGGKITQSPEILHGKTSAVRHDGLGLYFGLPVDQTVDVTRYHSLVADPTAFPKCLEISSKTANGIIMGVRHVELQIEGVQFHPESILTDKGMPMLHNFLLHQSGKRPTSAKQCVQKLQRSGQITEGDLRDALTAILRGGVNEAQISALLGLLPVEKITPSLLNACADTVLSFTKQIPNVKVPNNYIDIVGTGGDGKDTFNASTAAGLIIAACGGKVMKHGNRSSSGAFGSADLIEAMGVKIDLNEEQIGCLAESSSYAFLFSQSFHPNMKQLNASRKQLGLRTIFNLLGPLTNPVRPGFQVIGVPNESLGKIFAEALVQRKSGRHFVISSFDGTDEVSIATPTHLWIVENGEIKYQVIKPEDFGIKPYESIDMVCNLTVPERIDRLKRILEGEDGPFTDFVLLNAAVGLYCAKLANDLKSSFAVARDALKAKKVKEVLNNYVNLTQRLAGTKTILNTIVQQRRLDVAAAKTKASFDHLKTLLPHAPPPINFISRIKQAGVPAIFAEVKRASPSKGDIAPRIDAAEVGLIYARAGAAVVSVLTEPKWFKGTLGDMRAVRTAVDRLGPHARPAVLCKDFIFDEYQIYQARIYGADALLLIVAAIHDDQHLVRLIKLTRELGMEPLVEVNTDNEMQRALQCDAHVIGINNRNLHTFNVDLDTTTRLAQSITIPQHVTLVALSGISSRADVEKFEDIGVHAVLVGEALMKSPNPHRMLKELAGQTPPPFVKICGIKSVLAASTAALAGADMIGLIFAPKSSRRVEIDTAKEIARVVRNLRSATSSPSQLISMLPMRVKTNRNQAPEKWFGEWSSYLESAVHLYKPLIVGVFADQSPKEIELIAAEVGLDIIQLSGDEGFAAASNHPTRPVIKAVHVETNDSAESVLSRILPGHGAAVLLDTRSGAQKGGTGTTFDWSVAKALQNRGLPVVLAGGLNLDNVSTAVNTVRPFMVDVATGVETAGQKDLEKIKAFIRLAKFSEGIVRKDCVIHRGPGTGVSPMPARFGDFGGRYVPETLIEALEELERTYWEAKNDPAFHAEVNQLLGHFVGRPTPVYFAKRLTEEAGGARIWFKREDLCHTGAHKINNSVAQAILAKRLGKKRIIAETGAGQHGVATATACALLGLECTVYMGSEDCKRQSLNVFRMNNLGTKVIAVESGSRTLKDAINEAMRDWVTNVRTTHYLVGSAIGPHPFPTIVRDFQSVIGYESKKQMLLHAGKLPDVVMACVGGGSNSIGMFYPYIQEPTKIVGVEAGGHGVASGKHSATLSAGTPGVLHGTRTYLLQDDMGQITETHSLSAGLDYPGVGPEHAWLKATGRGVYVSVTDEEAMIGFDKLSRTEGIVPALETSHAIYQAIKMAPEMRKDQDILIVLSGRGDKDFMTVANTLGVSLGDSVSVLGANLRKT